jgi:hypothetical protein
VCDSFGRSLTSYTRCCNRPLARVFLLSNTEVVVNSALFACIVCSGLVALTGVSHPYEYPDKAELTIDAGVVPVETSVDLIVGTGCTPCLALVMLPNSLRLTSLPPMCLHFNVFCVSAIVPHGTAEYLISTGYIRKDVVPTRYTAVDPELVLKANNVVTDKIVDPAFRLCADKTAGHMAAVVSLTSTTNIEGALKKRGWTVEVPSQQEIQAAEVAVGAVDSPWVTTPLSTPMLQSQLVEAGWGYAEHTHSS